MLSLTAPCNFDLNYINKGGSQGTDKSIKIHFVDSINFNSPTSTLLGMVPLNRTP